MKKYKFDFFVIGGGSGGVRAARYASSLGMKVGLTEGLDLGGTCVNRGCIPKKLYSFASHFLEEQEIMKSFGWDIKKTKFNWSRLVSNKEKELKRLTEIYNSLLDKSGVTIFKKWAKFSNDGLILSNDTIVEAKYFLVAVGGYPRILDIKGKEFCITSDEAFDLKKLPKKILIVGAGYIAVEFASIFNGLGVNTTICSRSGKILTDFDDEISTFLKTQLLSKGIKFLDKKTPLEVKKYKNTLLVHFKDFKEKYDQVMFASGRIPHTKNLNLNEANVKVLKNGAIKVDDYFETSRKNFFAIGDVIDKIQLTPVAISEAMLLVDNLFKKKKKKFSYTNIPTAVFSNPNLATIGLTEAIARKKFKNIIVFKSVFRPLKLTLSKSDEKVFIKLIVNKVNNVVLGLHYVGPDAAEIVQGFSVAIVNGLKKSDFDRTIGIHPSSSEEIVTLR